MANYPHLRYDNDKGGDFARNLDRGLDVGQKLRFIVKGDADRAVAQDLEAGELRNETARANLELQPLRKKSLELQLKEAEKAAGLDEMSPLQFKLLEAASDPDSGVFAEGGETEANQKRFLTDAEPVTTLPGGQRLMFSPKARAMRLQFKEQKARAAAGQPSQVFQLKDEEGQVVGNEVIQPDGSRKIEKPVPPEKPQTIQNNDFNAQWQNYRNGRKQLKALMVQAAQSGNPIAIADAREDLKSYDESWKVRQDHLAKTPFDPSEYADVEEFVDKSTGEPQIKIKRKVHVSQLGNLSARSANPSGNDGPAPSPAPATPPAPAPSVKPERYVPGQTTVQKNGKTYLYIGNEQWEEQ